MPRHYRRAHQERTYHRLLHHDHHRHHLPGQSLRTSRHSTILKCKSWKIWNPGPGSVLIGLAWWRKWKAARLWGMWSVTTEVLLWLKGWTKSQLIQQVIVALSSTFARAFGIESRASLISLFCRQLLIHFFFTLDVYFGEKLRFFRNFSGLEPLLVVITRIFCDNNDNAAQSIRSTREWEFQLKYTSLIACPSFVAQIASSFAASLPWPKSTSPAPPIGEPAYPLLNC